MKTKGKSGVMDMTQGNMAMLILSFALPLMLGNVFQQFYTVADTAIVGKILGVDALAALGTVESINWLVLGTIQGITQGFGILVSQQFGAKKEEALQETIFHASFLAVVAAILFTVGILIGLPGLVGILQVPVDIRPICLDYLYVLFGGIPLMMLYNFTAAMLRAFGDSKTPLTACVIAALFNIALDLYFILELGWGVKGAALATVIAQTLASAYCLWKLCRIEVLAEKRKAAKWRLHAGLCGKLIYLGLPMAFQNLVIAIGGMIVQTVVNSFGVAFIAGYTATCKLYGILEVAATSYGFAMVTYTGQNLGAGKLKYKIFFDEVIKVRLKYNYSNNSLDIKAITGAVKNPNFCSILDCVSLARELNRYLDKYVTFEPRLTGQMLHDQLAKQDLVYPF